MSPAVKIRPGDLQADRDGVIALLSRYVNPAYDRRRFDWVYRDNPAGPGRLWVAVDGSRGELIGSAGALPRLLCVDGEQVVGWVLTDFCVSDSHRSLGPALQLQRACLEELEADGAAVWYDFPGPSMEAVYRRLGVRARTDVTRFARPLRTYAKLRERLGSAILAGPLSLAGDLALSWATHVRRVDRSVVVASHVTRCGEEFTALAQCASPRPGICVWRSAEYLSWRYCDSPVQRHDVVTARREGRLVAYLIVGGNAEAPILVDLFGETTSLRTLIISTVAVLRRSGGLSVSAWLHDAPPVAALLRDLGFRPRETAPVMLGRSPRSSWGSAMDGSWFLTYGDRDT